MATDTRPRPPSVEAVLAVVRRELDGSVDPDALTAAARFVVADERERLGAGGGPRSVDDLAAGVASRLAMLGAVRLETVINATGVIVHTNLGRAPWPRAAIEAAAEAAGAYLLLELDRGTGRRGARFRQAEEHLVALTGAEDALVTNNNAAAVGLAVGLAGRGRGVAVSRGELVEIGGGVRIPEIVRRAGAKLIEVGTTNRTRVADFEEVLASGKSRAVLRVHPSNFRQDGFTETPDAAELAAMAHRHGAIVVDDLGSGALLPTERYGLSHEPMPSERLAFGSDIVTFSGDKLVGGPQAGFVVGRADLVARIRRDPLARAMRPDKVDARRRRRDAGAVPRRPGRIRDPRLADDRDAASTSCEARARRIESRDLAGAGGRRSTLATVGGGSLPGETLPSHGLAIAGRAQRIVDRLRVGEPPVIGRIEQGRAVVDLRTVDPGRDADLTRAILDALRS